MMLVFTVWCPLTELDVSVPDVYPSVEAGVLGKVQMLCCLQHFGVILFLFWLSLMLQSLHNISARLSVSCALLNHRLYGDPWFLWTMVGDTQRADMWCVSNKVIKYS